MDKRDKRKKRMEARNEKLGDSDSGSEIESEEDEEGGDKDKAVAKKDEEAKGHAPLKKTDEELRKAQFLGEKFGHYKIGTYVRVELQLDKAISRKLEPDYPIVVCSLKHQEFSISRRSIKKTHLSLSRCFSYKLSSQSLRKNQNNQKRQKKNQRLQRARSFLLQNSQV